MTRWLLTLASVLSLLLCIAMLVLWMRSQSQELNFGGNLRGSYYWVFLIESGGHPSPPAPVATPIQCDGRNLAAGGDA